MGGGTCESSVVVGEGGMCFGRDRVFSSAMLVTGKFLFCFLRMKEENLAIKNLSWAREQQARYKENENDRLEVFQQVFFHFRRKIGNTIRNLSGEKEIIIQIKGFLGIKQWTCRAVIGGEKIILLYGIVVVDCTNGVEIV